VEGTSDRESARLSRGPRGTGLGGLQATAVESLRDPLLTSSEEATGVPEAGVRERAAETIHRSRLPYGCRSGSRAVKRDSPQPRSHRAAPSFPVPSPASLRTSAERGAKEDHSRERARASRLGTRAGPARAPKGLTRIQSQLRWETTKHRVLELNCFGVQKSIGRIARSRRPSGATKRTSDTRDLARRKRRRRSDAHQRRQNSGDNDARAKGARLLNGGQVLGSRCARKPRRDRIRRGAGSGTREVLGPRAHG